jgi:hypothetical protein
VLSFFKLASLHHKYHVHLPHITNTTTNTPKWNLINIVHPSLALSRFPTALYLPQADFLLKGLFRERHNLAMGL